MTKKKVKSIYILILVLLLCITYYFSRNLIGEIHQLDYMKSEFRRLPVATLSVKEWIVDEKTKQRLSIDLNSKIKDETQFLFNYRVQIIGYFLDNKKQIWFNGFCSSLYKDTESYWKDRYVGILHAGKCAFEGVYDFEKSKVIEFYMEKDNH